MEKNEFLGRRMTEEETNLNGFRIVYLGGEMLKNREGGGASHYTKLLQRKKKYMGCLEKGEPHCPGVETGFFELDEALGGLQGGRLTILAARTSVGKTTLLLNIASHIAIRNKIHIIFFSTEMSTESLTERVLADQLDFSAQKLQEGSIEDSVLQRMKDFWKITNDRFGINDDSNITIQTICELVELHKKTHPVKVVFVDYIQRVGSKKTRQRYEEIGDVTRQLQAMAKKLDVHVMCAAQLSRNAESRARPRAKQSSSPEPQLSDLRESGNIEQDADAVLLLSKNESVEYGKTHQIDIAKNRHGESCTIMLAHNGRFARFTDNLNRCRGNEKGE